MHAEQRGLEIRVGVFVLAALLILLAFVVMLGHIRLRPGLRLYADFAYTAALQASAPVKVGGIEVGQVSELSLLPPNASPPPAAAVPGLGRSTAPIIRARLSLDPAAQAFLGPGATFALATQGIIGESYLELMPGGQGTALAADSAVRGIDAPRLHLMVLQLAAVMQTVGGIFGAQESTDTGELGHALAGMVGTIGGVLHERRDALSASIANLSAASGDLKGIASGLREGIGDGQNIKALVRDTRVTVEMVQKELPALLQHGQAAISSLDSLARKADTSIDPNTLRHILAETKTTTDNLQSLTTEAQVLVRGMRRGEGTVGAFLQDPTIFDDLKEMVRDIKQHPYKFLWRD